MSTTSSEETTPGSFIIDGYKYTPKTYTFTITDKASTEAVKPPRTITTGPEISYAGIQWCLFYAGDSPDV